MLGKERIEAGCRGEGKQGAHRVFAAQGDSGLDHVLQRRSTFCLQTPPGAVGDPSPLSGLPLGPAQGHATRFYTSSEVSQKFSGRL